MSIKAVARLNEVALIKGANSYEWFECTAKKNSYHT